ncbi:hypothetical protein PHMEG_00037074 [Phytophthora megakarya]|uniref:FHA domain-containing protein n=1 Tax=Phytophthora megakarya TaxID=4795 RepID=A0A225UKQ2_9STRA|nr:hypothetical protein PHMEG_00037074 [Phytophthora megakarya]
MPPWGQLVPLHHSNVTPHPILDLFRSRHYIGRVANRSDIVIPENFISGQHCIVRLLGKDDQGEPIVEIEDISRNGLWVNNSKVRSRSKILLMKDNVIRFTKPQEAMQLSYRLETLPSGLTQRNEDLHARLSADELVVVGRKRTREEDADTPRPEPRLKRIQSSATQDSVSLTGTPAALQLDQLKKIFAEEVATLSCTIAKNVLKTLKSEMEDLAKVRKELDAVRRDRDRIKQTLDHILAIHNGDPDFTISSVTNSDCE